MLQKVVAETPGAVAAYKESARVKMALGRRPTRWATPPPRPRIAEGDPEAAALAVETTVARALDYVAAQKADLAVQDLTRLRDGNPDSVAVRVGLAQALVATRQADAAIVELQKAVELAPSAGGGALPARPRAAPQKQNAAGRCRRSRRRWPPIPATPTTASAWAPRWWTPSNTTARWRS